VALVILSTPSHTSALSVEPWSEYLHIIVDPTLGGKERHLGKDGDKRVPFKSRFELLWRWPVPAVYS
jgi:hypothetical protein